MIALQIQKLCLQKFSKSVQLNKIFIFSEIFFCFSQHEHYLQKSRKEQNWYNLHSLYISLDVIVIFVNCYSGFYCYYWITDISRILMSERNVKPLYYMYTVASNTFSLTLLLHHEHLI
jgi:ABC-type multidrug transport system permease subunit